MSEEPTARDPEGQEARIDALDERLKVAREREEQRTGSKADTKSDADYSLGNRVLAELIAGIGGGAFIGWVIDHFAGWRRPWGLLVVMTLGIVVAFRNIIRISNRRPD
jgi:ATP synthase protein I